MTIKTETKIGIVGVLTIAILIWGVNFLKGKNLFEKQNTYYAKYDNINGLLPTSYDPHQRQRNRVGNVRKARPKGRLLLRKNRRYNNR